MIQIQNFNASLRQVIRDIYFFVHMIAEHISDLAKSGWTRFSCDKSCRWNSSGHRLSWNQRWSRLPNGLSVNSGSSNFILGPLSFPCFMAKAFVCGKVSSLLESTWFHIFFPLFFSLWHFYEPWTSNITFFWGGCFKVWTHRRKKLNNLNS